LISSSVIPISSHSQSKIAREFFVCLAQYSNFSM
jgi:hypothetical protein